MRLLPGRRFLAVCFLALLAAPQITRASIEGQESTAGEDAVESQALGCMLDGPAFSPSDPIEPERFVCTTKCAIEGASPKCTGWVTGEGIDKTESDACKAAKANANDNVEKLLPGEGCKAKHCRPCKCQKK